jgi:hypothetical protein
VGSIISWLEGLQGGAPQFLGALTGSFLGLLGLLLGALYNAHLNRKRDDRLRNEERRSVAVALRAELASVRDGLLSNAEMLEKDEPTDFFVPDIADLVRLWPELKSKFGLLNEETIRAIMTAFLLIEEYAGKLVMMRGHVHDSLPSGRVIIEMPKDRTMPVAKLNRVTAAEIDNAVKRLDAELGL